MEILYIPRGDAFNLPLLFTDNTDSDNPVPFDLTGYTVFLTVKYKWDKSGNDDNAVIEKETSTHDNAANGETSFNLTETDTNQDIEEYKADIQIVDGSGNINSSDEFAICFTDDITKRTS